MVEPPHTFREMQERYLLSRRESGIMVNGEKRGKRRDKTLTYEEINEER